MNQPHDIPTRVENPPINTSTPCARAALLIGLACATAGCELLNVHAHNLDNERCERSSITYDDQKACNARRQSLSDYDKRRKSQDEDLRLGPRKAPAPAG